MKVATASRKASDEHQRQLTSEIDELSLTQALLDFEIANARVIDLTQRLVEANQLVEDLRQEVDDLRTELTETTSEHEAMRGSQAFRLASKIWAMRNAIRG